MYCHNVFWNAVRNANEMVVTGWEAYETVKLIKHCYVRHVATSSLLGEFCRVQWCINVMEKLRIEGERVNLAFLC